MSNERNDVNQQPTAKRTLSLEICQEIDGWVARFPEGKQRSAVISALQIVQHHNQGFLTAPLMDAVADYLKLPKVQVYEVATFYSMFETKRVGRHSVSVCTNISCMLCGGEDILGYIENKLGVKVGETTPDGRVYLKQEEECLAACVGAPMMMVDHKYYENLTPEKVDEILDGLD
ncbi:MAG: NAD(P)H-dependent oxidoreductase subunit E [Gammaproteobacteria bacterium]|nr:NAD(P)H-dependent oxidoreductase subunit E [Gammaproteobacteria bacterium]